MGADKLRPFKPWLSAAAAYNLGSGLSNVFFPRLVFRAFRMRPPQHLPFWQVVGMIVRRLRARLLVGWSAPGAAPAHRCSWLAGQASGSAGLRMVAEECAPAQTFRPGYPHQRPHLVAGLCRLPRAGCPRRRRMAGVYRGRNSRASVSGRQRLTGPGSASLLLDVDSGVPVR
jgi:hypothetical protein